jgi:hypothetical protein
MDAMMRLAKVEMRLVPVVPFASGGGGIESKVALASPIGSEVGGGAKKRRAASAGDDSGGVVRRAKRTPVVRGDLLLSAGKGEMADGKAGGGSAVVAEVPAIGVA